MIAPSVTFPKSAPIALGGTTSAAQVLAARGNLAAQVRAGSAVYALLRWNTGINAWEQIATGGVHVVAEPSIQVAAGTATTIFDAIPNSYYTALLVTAQPDGSPSNLLGLDIQDAGPPVGPAVVTLIGDANGPSNNNTVTGIQRRPFSSSAPAVGDSPVWSGIEWAPGSARIDYAVAGAATGAGLPVMTDANGRIVVAGTTPEDMFALRGISITSAAALGNQIAIAGNSAKTGPIFGGLTIRESQWVAGGIVIPQSALSAYVAGATPGSWYRRIGHAISAQEIFEDWGEPLQVPEP